LESSCPYSSSQPTNIALLKEDLSFSNRKFTKAEECNVITHVHEQLVIIMINKDSAENNSEM